MLAAHAKGLGTCPMTGPVLLAQDELRRYLQIEPEKQINMVISLGFPKDKPKKLQEKKWMRLQHLFLKTKIKRH